MKNAKEVYSEFKSLSKEEMRTFLTLMFGKCYRGRRVAGGDKASDLEAKLKTIHRYVLGIEHNDMFTDEEKTFSSMIAKIEDRKHRDRVSYAFKMTNKTLRNIQQYGKEHVFLLEMLDELLDVMREDR